MADDQPVLLHDDPVDDQPEDFLLGFERRVDERIPDAFAERLQPLQQPEFLLTFRALPMDLLEPGSKVAAMVLDPSPALLQLRERDRCCLVGIDQAFCLAIRCPELPLNARPLALTGTIDSGVAASMRRVVSRTARLCTSGTMVRPSSIASRKPIARYMIGSIMMGLPRNKAFDH